MVEKNLKKKLVGLRENISLAPYTTFKIGGKARYFYLAKTKKEIIEAISVAKKEKIPFFILGGGSNLLVSDEGYEGLVIKIKNSKFEIQNSKVMAEAGLDLADLVKFLAKKGLSGLEWAMGIPGTVGGAVKGNAGAFGKSMRDVVEKVEIFDIESEKIKILKNKDCKFAYRESIFKKNPKLIILTVFFQLERKNKKEIKEKIKEYLKYREENQPLNFPSAGCIFKNPSGLSAGKLIEECGLKGKKIGKAQISPKHANFIINLGGAKATEVKKLIELIKERVKERFKIELEEEIFYLGF